MTLFLKLFLISSILLVEPVFAASACFAYEPATVKLVGKLHRATYPGAPNFESVKDGDTPETGYYLTLKHPICTSGAVQNDQAAIASVKEIQLVLNQSQYQQWRPRLGTQVELSGTLFPAMNGHHHTDVLLKVDE